MCLSAHIFLWHTHYRSTTRGEFLITVPAVQTIGLLAREKRLISLLWNPIAPVIESPDGSPASIQAGGLPVVEESYLLGVGRGLTFLKRKDRAWQLRWLLSWKPTRSGSRHLSHSLILSSIAPIFCPSGLHWGRTVKKTHIIGGILCPCRCVRENISLIFFV